MGPEESGVGDNSWEPQNDNPPNVTSHYLPPISGRGKVSFQLHMLVSGAYAYLASMYTYNTHTQQLDINNTASRTSSFCRK